MSGTDPTLGGLLGPLPPLSPVDPGVARRVPRPSARPAPVDVGDGLRARVVELEAEVHRLRGLLGADDLVCLPQMSDRGASCADHEHARSSPP